MNVQFFDNLDDMFDALDRGIEQAQLRATPEQTAITYGDYWMRAWEDILIFGYIYTKEEFRAAEVELGASEEELEWERKVYDNSYNNGFRFGRAYSVLEPNGELGDTHVSDMTKITKEEFESARSLGWDFEKIVDNTDWFINYVRSVL
jgi:hypothetical protein